MTPSAPHSSPPSEATAPDREFRTALLSRYLADPQVSASSSRVHRKPRRKLQGWRFGVALASTSAITAFIVNLGLAVAGYVFYHHDMTSGIGTVYNGDCSTVDTLATALHILINILSSMLLSASNYTMQVLSAPTRAEIDDAHVKGTWLDIGVASVRNICGCISRHRIAMWWVRLSNVPCVRMDIY